MTELMNYQHSKIESKWQKIWRVKKIYGAKEGDKNKKNLYHLVMFPYPSGNLHIGHWYNFAPADVYARFKRMRGFNVLSPIGFDAFGLPAENAAIKRGIHPAKWTLGNIKMMTKQLLSMGNSYDWLRMVITCEPDYYKWNQWFFLEMYKRGLAYRKKAPANWCPSCKTVLANEQVVLGKCERCGTVVVQKNIEQWLLKITDYAERLLKDLDGLDWPEKTKIMQRNWIGKSEGAIIKFKVQSSPPKTDPPMAEKFKIGEVEVFTTRPDTLFGATYMVLAPEHALVASLLNNKSQIPNYKQVERYIKNSKEKTELQRINLAKEKTGVELKGVKAVNPATKKEIPIWIADYVLASYGTGAIMGVPAHDERDFKFAKKFKLPVIQVIAKKDAPIRSYLMGAKDISDSDLTALGISIKEKTKDGDRKIEIPEDRLKNYEELISQKMTSRFWNEYVGKEIVFIFKHKDKKVERLVLTPSTEGRIDKLAAKFVGEKWNKQNVWKWLAENSWYTDLIIHTEEGVEVNSGKFDGLESKEAKWKITDFVGGKRRVQYRLRDWLISRQRYWGTPIPIVYCDRCGTQPVPEKYLPVKLPPLKDFKPSADGRSPLARSKQFLKTKCPKCRGEAERETDTMDTFVDSSWYFFRYIDNKNKRKFADGKKIKNWLPVNIYIGGAEHSVLHLLYARFFSKFIYDQKLCDFKEPFMALRHQGIILGSDGQKMSKSRGNVVDPDSLVKEFGADAVRMHLCFMGDYSHGGPWNPTGILGVVRFLNRALNLFYATRDNKKTISSKELERALHQTIKKIGEDIEMFSFNTAVSSLMVLLNKMEENKAALNLNHWEAFLKILSPFAPHFSEELWHIMKTVGADSIHLENWPEYDSDLIKEETFELVVQINGRVRDSFAVPQGISRAEAEKLTLERQNVKRYLSTGEPKRIIYVAGRLINIVF